MVAVTDERRLVGPVGRKQAGEDPRDDRFYCRERCTNYASVDFDARPDRRFGIGP